MARTMSYAAQAMHGEIAWGSASNEWTGASLDSRRVSRGDLFFALAGERVDGHEFIGSALDAGAAGAVFQRHPEIEGEPQGVGIRVDDTFAALHALTASVRQEKPEHVVAVTGTTGKTTTKELLGLMLAKHFRTAVSPGNLNNLYGFPLALLNIREDTEWMVAEMGMSEPGELGRVSRLGRPEIGVFTNIGEAHLERLGSIEAVAAAKAELLYGLCGERVVVANADDPWVTKIANKHVRDGGEVLWFGRSGSDVHVKALRAGSGRTLFTLGAPQGLVDIELNLHGLYNAWNFAAAATAALHLGVSLPEIAEAGLEVEPQPMRGRVVDLGRLLLVDDSYNSNPRAFTAALRSAAELPHRRRVVVAGSMLELGDVSERLHAQAGRAAAAQGFNPVIGVGREARALVDAAAEAGAESHWFEDAAEAVEPVTGMVKAGDVVLVKGSRGVGLEVVVAALETAAEESGDAV